MNNNDNNTEIFVELGINTLQKDYFTDYKKTCMIEKICRKLKIHCNFYLGNESFESSHYIIVCEEYKLDQLLKQLKEININYDKLIYHEF